MSNKARIELEIDLDSQNGQDFMARFAMALSGSVVSIEAEVKQPDNVNIPTEEQPGPKRKRTSKNTPEASAEPAPPTPVEDNAGLGKAEEIDVNDAVDETAAVAQEAASAVTLDDLRVKTTAKAKDHRDAIKAKLTNDFKANNVASLSPEHYVAYNKFLDSLS